MNETRMKQIRGRVMARLGRVLKDPQRPTVEGQEAAVQALCLSAATIFLAQNHIPFTSEGIEALAMAAVQSFDKWHEEWKSRN